MPRLQKSARLCFVMFRLTLHNNPQHAQSHFVLGLAHSHQPGSPAGSERLEAFREAFCHWKAYSINTFFSVATMAKLWVRRSALATLPIKSSSDQQARAPKLNTNRHSGSSKGYRRSSLMWNTWVGKVFAHHITAKSYSTLVLLCGTQCCIMCTFGRR